MEEGGGKEAGLCDHQLAQLHRAHISREYITRGMYTAHRQEGFPPFLFPLSSVHMRTTNDFDTYTYTHTHSISSPTCTSFQDVKRGKISLSARNLPFIAMVSSFVYCMTPPFALGIRVLET